MIFRRFERLIDAFRPAPDEMPPTHVGAFYLHFLKQAWPAFALLLAVGLIGALIEVALFDFIGQIVDLAGAAPNSTVFFEQHGATLAWMGVVTLVIRPLVISLHDLLVHQTITPSLTTLIRWQNHRYVLKQSLGFFHGDFAGRIANRVMQTGVSLRDSSVQAVDAIWHVLIFAVTSLILFAQADIWLMVPLILWIIGYVIALWYFVPQTKERSAIASESRSQLAGRIVDGYTNITTLKLFSHSAQEEQYARQAMEEQTAKAEHAARLITAMGVTIAILSGFLIAGTTGLALWLWHQGVISVGAIALATGLVIRINSMSGWIMWVVNGVFENIGMVQDGMTTVSKPRLVADVPDAKPLAVTRGGVLFDDIQFHYGKGAGIIEGLTLDVAPGEKIGLVGPSGAGKSTLINLLLRLYDLEGGRILIDGQDIAQVTQESLRCQIGVVTQDTSLLHRSIRDNLLYGRPEASDEELHAALHKAKAEDFIARITDAHGRHGLDAQVGERGVKLSGGQRQRIAIARTLLKDAPILLLDEATSALDSEVEAAIQESLETLMAGKTVIAIAHRLSTISRMDRLVVMERGQIVEMGSHDELLAHNGLYARLWRHQTGGFVGQGVSGRQRVRSSSS